MGTSISAVKVLTNKTSSAATPTETQAVAAELNRKLAANPSALAKYAPKSAAAYAKFPESVRKQMTSFDKQIEAHDGSDAAFSFKVSDILGAGNRDQSILYAASIGGGGNQGKLVLFDSQGRKVAAGSQAPGSTTYTWSFAKSPK